MGVTTHPSMSNCGVLNSIVSAFSETLITLLEQQEVCEKVSAQQASSL